MKLNYMMFKFLLLIPFLFHPLYSAPSSQEIKQLRYKTSFGQCPSRTAGTFTLQLVKEFEKNFSLRKVKEKIVNENLAEKHFISKYKIQYDPLQRKLKFSVDCPTPLMKVQVYKDNGLDSYDAILVDTGALYDPIYAELLRNEKKLNFFLPYLALPLDEMNSPVQKDLTRLLSKMSYSFRKKLSEVILNRSKELTIILSVKNHPSSAFLGSTDWEDKFEKLQKIITYMELKKKIPAIINITNSKKVVVKFNDKF